jgi:diguanylate cyclase (GGDEF)-like protein/PAS domain S-box-containing protein
MDDAGQCASGLAADHEALLEFLYLTPVGIIKFRDNGQVVMINPVAVKLLMPLSATTVMSNVYDLFTGVVPNLRMRIEQFDGISGVIFDQRQIFIAATRSVLTLGVNRVAADTLMAVIQDITLAIQQEKRIRDDQERFRAIFDNIRGCAICTVDFKGRVEGWNRSLNRLGGWEPADLSDRPIGALFSRGGDGQLDYGGLLEQANRCGSAEAEGWAVRKDGTRFWGHVVGTVLPDQDGGPSGYVVVTRDLSDRKAMEDRLVRLASTDPLTGASNRRAGETKLDEEYSRWRRYQRHFTLLIMDCDHFKSVNDTWGHDVGDAVLISLVRRCRDGLRKSDAIIRWGGEEFLLLLPETRCEEAAIIADRLRSSIEATQIQHDGHGVSVTVSIGVAEVGQSDASVQELISRADRALYLAKSNGRNRVVNG